MKKFFELLKEEVKRTFLQVLQMTREMRFPVLWVFLIVFFTFPSWIMRYVIELPSEDFLKFLQSAMTTSSKNFEGLIANIAIAFFVWFDATIISRPQKKISIYNWQKRKHTITIVALFCVFISGGLWVLSSFEKSLESVAGFWKSDVFIITLYGALFAMWSYMKYLGISSKAFTQVKRNDADSRLREKIMKLEKNNKKKH